MAKTGKESLEEKMKEIAKKHNLKGSDIFIKTTKSGEHMYIIINRAGIDKLEKEIQTREENPVMVMWEPLVLNEGCVYTRWKIIEGGKVAVDTTGEATKANCPGNPYLLSMAEKRGRSRAILKYLGYYDITKGEDESDEFEKTSKKNGGAIIKE